MSVRGVMSDNLSLLFGIRQDSVLVPALFNTYEKPLGTIAQRYGVNYRLRADDTQLCVFLDPRNKADASFSLENLKHCIADIQLWMTSKLFKPVEDKAYIYGWLLNSLLKAFLFKKTYYDT